MDRGNTGISAPVMWPQQYYSGRDAQEETSSRLRRYQYVPNERDREMFSRVVVVPSTNVRKIYPLQNDMTRPKEPLTQNNGRLANEHMDMRSVGPRQPTEHPNDKPPMMGNGTHYSAPAGYKKESVLHNMENLSIRTPSEHPSQPPAQHTHEGNLGHAAHSRQTNAMIQSNQRVAEWQNLQSDDEQSFVIDDVQSSRSGFDDYENSSDDEMGFQKSLSFIQRPPEVDTSSCSRQNSNGSQSSLESSLSFHTVYPSGDGYPQHKPAHQKQPDGSKRQQVTTPAPAEHHQQSTSARPPATTSTEPYFGRSQSQPGAYGFNRQTSGQSGVRQINQRADEASRQEVAQKPTSVFITYAEEQNDKNFKKLVLQLTRTLLSNGIQVRLDMLESTLMSMSVSSWLDDNIQKCDFVVVCVSPSYKSEVEQQMSTTTPDPHSLHTRYIYNRLLTEYIQNGSLNYRFIPVLIGGANRKDLPSLCLDTHVYEWPKDFEAIIYRLFKKEKYIQPKVGPPPKCTVETYDAFDDRVLNARSSNHNFR